MAKDSDILKKHILGKFINKVNLQILMKDKAVPDTSVLIEGILSEKIENKEITVKEIIIHEAAVAELEHQANENKSKGYLGLDELQKLRELASKYGFEIKFTGKKPSGAEIHYAKQGEIDAMIRELAYEQDATLVTADKVQRKVAEAKGIDCLFVHMKETARKLKLDSYFDETTMSVHLREGIKAYSKKGKPGEWAFVEIGKKLLTQDEVQDISREIIEEAGIRKDGFVEIERPGSTIVQLGKYRIVITRPPFSDGWEITAVRPVKRLSLPDYHLSEKLDKRIKDQAEGVLIAGAPGMGKSTFAQALAEYYASQNRTVKTVEAPRDLILAENVTQYAISHGDSQEVHDVLLLSRPDNTIFDEMRNTADFLLFADLRLAGIGMAGVVHATNPIDAIQRFVGKLELGVIPQVIDTVIFIDKGMVAKVLSLQMMVKVPAGMTEADLARPVVVVSDFENNRPEFELYTYGEQTVVVPIRGNAGKTGVQKLAAQQVVREFQKYSDAVDVEMLSDNKAIVKVPTELRARVIGKKGETINAIEKKLGISIDIQDLEKGYSTGEIVPFSSEIRKKNVLIDVGSRHAHKDVDIFSGGDYLLSAKVGKTGIVKITKKNKIGKILEDALNSGEGIEVKVSK